MTVSEARFSDPDMSGDEGTYEVEEILGDRLINNQRYFYLKWKGYPHSENTWEPEENLSCAHIVAQYIEGKQPRAALKRHAAQRFPLSALIAHSARHTITVTNAVDCESLPENFTYAEHNVWRAHEAQLPSSVVFPCTCTQACGSSCECMRVPYYSDEGLLCTDYQGPITECNYLCKCPPECLNRVVQRGSDIDMEIFRTACKGWGARARRRIRAGEFVCTYTGELLTFSDSELRDASKSTYLFDLDKEVPTSEQAYFTIDAREFGNISHFFNHSCEPNLAIWAVYVNHLDPRLHELAFFAVRDIEVAQELTFDYNPGSFSYSDDFCDARAQDDDGKRFRCFCKTPSCRKFIFN